MAQTAGVTVVVFQEALVIRDQPNSTTAHPQPQSEADEEQQYMMALAASQVRFYFPVFGNFGLTTQQCERKTRNQLKALIFVKQRG